ncbi:MAG: GGDEF domain-containing protein [Deltaproteobacteria bacterium]|nr:GGDEF domain-containing protein [Deltaproteobacteria bacterium]
MLPYIFEAHAPKILKSQVIANHQLFDHTLSAGPLSSLNLEELSKSDLIAMVQNMAVENSLDGLTGLYNQAFFRRFLELSFKRAKREKGHLALMFMDLDGFKAANDIYGHIHGDRILKKVAETLLKQIRDYDMVARVGGDEFAILFEGLEPEKAAVRAADISTAVNLALTELKGGVTASFGLAPLNGQASPEIFYHDADQSMYRHKRSKKPRVLRSVNAGLTCS